MRNYCLTIQIKDSTPMIWRSIRVCDGLTFRQLHEAILTLFGWKDSEPYRFQMKQMLVSSSNEQDVRQHLKEYLDKQQSFQYIYGNVHEEWSVDVHAIPIFGFDPYKNEISLLAHEQNHPPYGIGGIALYQKMLEEVKNPDSLHFHAIHMILEHTRPPFDAVSIQRGLDNILSDTFTNQLDEVKDNLKQLRVAIEQTSLEEPYLVVIQQADHSYPVYIDVLENGIEILIFYDENGFCRSILNSTNGDPDLLFTSSLTIDFLDEQVEESDLLLSDHKNLCFRNRPGCLPSYPTHDDINLLSMILHKLLFIFPSTTNLPSLSSQKMVVLDESLKQHVQDFIMKEEVCSIRLTTQNKQELTTLPHTNEHMSLNLLALPAKGFEATKRMDIHIVACGQDYTKEESISLQSIDILIDQLYYFFFAVFHERGLPECFHTNNLNLANIIKDMCKELSIKVKTATIKDTYPEDLMDIILSTLQLDEKDLQMLDRMEGNPKISSFPHSMLEEQEQPDYKPKILN